MNGFCSSLYYLLANTTYSMDGFLLLQYCFRMKTFFQSKTRVDKVVEICLGCNKFLFAFQKEIITDYYSSKVGLQHIVSSLPLDVYNDTAPLKDIPQRGELEEL
mmetsp:Transcript_8315/g.10996  ORF Transcript_8315/g.10996 Transcript_8315/m.10996 type:complete len:104 (+) Transcript_8315:206-517(+)